MFEYLEEYNERGKSDEIGSMLGSMSMLEVGRTADAAVWNDWERAFERAENRSKDYYYLRLKK